MISVIIPTYNRAEYLAESIQSVLGQTYTDFELIVVDDGSTDGTAGVVKGFADERIRYHWKENGGVSSARNMGLDLACGEYVAFLDSDDVWEPRKLELQRRLAEEAGLGLVFCDFQRFNAHHEQDTLFEHLPELRSRRARRWTKEVFQRAYRIDEDAFCALAETNIFATWVQASLLRLEPIRDIRFDTSLRLSEDFAYMLKVYLRVKAGYIDERLVRVRRHDGNSTKRAADHLPPRLYALQTCGAFRPEHTPIVKRMIGRTHAAIGFHHFAGGDYAAAKQSYRAAFGFAGSRRTALKHLVLSSIRSMRTATT